MTRADLHTRERGESETIASIWVESGAKEVGESAQNERVSVKQRKGNSESAE